MMTLKNLLTIISNYFVCWFAKPNEMLYTIGSSNGPEKIINSHYIYNGDDYNESNEDSIIIDTKYGINPANWLGYYTGNYKCNAHYNYLNVWATFF